MCVLCILVSRDVTRTLSRTAVLLLSKVAYSQVKFLLS